MQKAKEERNRYIWFYLTFFICLRDLERFGWVSWKGVPDTLTTPFFLNFNYMFFLLFFKNTLNTLYIKYNKLFIVLKSNLKHIIVFFLFDIYYYLL